MRKAKMKQNEAQLNRKFRNTTNVKPSKTNERVVGQIPSDLLKKSYKIALITLAVTVAILIISFFLMAIDD